MQHRSVSDNVSEKVRDHQPSFAGHSPPMPSIPRTVDGAPRIARPTLEGVSVADRSGESNPLTVVTPTEALERSVPLPLAADMAVEGLTDDEWTGFERALAER